MHPTERLIRAAMKKEEPIEAIYRAKPRLLCPHVLGEKGNRINVLSYQIGGESGSGLKPAGSPDNWRCMRLDEISGASARPDLEWQSVSRHTRPQTCVDIIYTEVPY